MGRRNRHHSEDEEESIFISMTDIMVGLLFIFILIIMYFALQAKLDAETISGQIFIIDEQQGQIDRGKAGSKEKRELEEYLVAAIKHRETILKWLQRYLTNEGIKGVEVDIPNGILRLPEGVLFRSGQYDIEAKSNAADSAAILAAALSKVLPCSVMANTGAPYRPYSECKRELYHNRNAAYIEAIFLEGHTDDRPISRLSGAPLITTNLKLSARRATNTFEEIIRKKPNLIRFHAPRSAEGVPVLAVSAYGETRPIRSNTSIAGRATNRRIDLRILMYKPEDIDAYRKLLIEAGVATNRQSP